jgi:hypothetical protein
VTGCQGYVNLVSSGPTAVSPCLHNDCTFCPDAVTIIQSDANASVTHLHVFGADLSAEQLLPSEALQGVQLRVKVWSCKQGGHAGGRGGAGQQTWQHTTCTCQQVQVHRCEACCSRDDRTASQRVWQSTTSTLWARLAAADGCALLLLQCSCRYTLHLQHARTHIFMPASPWAQLHPYFATHWSQQPLQTLTSPFARCGPAASTSLALHLGLPLATLCRHSAAQHGSTPEHGTASDKSGQPPGTLGRLRTAQADMVHSHSYLRRAP